jgi:hypothetical protein
MNRATNFPVHEIVGALIETLGFRHIGVVHDEYGVSRDGMKMFGVLDRAAEMEGCRFFVGVRNSHYKSMRSARFMGLGLSTSGPSVTHLSGYCE